MTALECDPEPAPAPWSPLGKGFGEGLVLA